MLKELKLMIGEEVEKYIFKLGEVIFVDCVVQVYEVIDDEGGFDFIVFILEGVDNMEEGVMCQMFFIVDDNVIERVVF